MRMHMTPLALISHYKFQSVWIKNLFSYFVSVSKLTTWSRILLKKLTATQLVSKFCPFSRTWKFKYCIHKCVLDYNLSYMNPIEKLITYFFNLYQSSITLLRWHTFGSAVLSQYWDTEIIFIVKPTDSCYGTRILFSSVQWKPCFMLAYSIYTFFNGPSQSSA
jgi:hypothetical protein